jgi:hypothetical protein
VTKLAAATAVGLAGALLFAIPAVDLMLTREAMSVVHGVVACTGLALLAISAAVDARKAR